MKVSYIVLLPVRMAWKNLFLFKLNNVPWGVSETSCNFTVFPSGQDLLTLVKSETQKPQQQHVMTMN